MSSDLPDGTEFDKPVQHRRSVPHVFVRQGQKGATLDRIDVVLLRLREEVQEHQTIPLPMRDDRAEAAALAGAGVGDTLLEQPSGQLDLDDPGIDFACGDQQCVIGNAGPPRLASERLRQEDARR
jgi:hypothetical protein